MHLIRYGLVLLASVAAVGCSSDGVVDPGGIVLSLSETSATVQQGGSQMVTATLTRIGGFTGSVNLTVTGAELGVTTLVSNMQTSGSVTTATVTFLAGTADPGVYPLVVHGTGIGVGEVTRAFTLTVPVTIPVGLGVSISLAPAALSIVQGASTPTTTVNITRVAHQGEVNLYVAGLPAGVTASFDPVAWPAESSTRLTLTVAATVVPGSYNLQVNAFDVESDVEVSARLTLTVTAPPPAPGYTLSLSDPALGMTQNAWGSSIVRLTRSNFTGNVALSVENLPAGVRAVFTPENSPIPGSPPVMHLFVARDVLPGTYTDLLVRGVAFGLSDRTAPLTLTITVAPFILTLSSSTLSIVQGAAASTTVNVIRRTFAGPVTLYVSGDFDEDGALPPGVTGAFSTNPVTGDSSVLTVSVSAATVPGVYPLWVSGNGSTGWFDEMITLTVTARSP